MLIAMLLIAATPVPANNPGYWIATNDYPLQEKQALIEGRVTFSVEVSHEGTPVKCSIIASSGSAALDDATCQLVMSRAKFKPAGPEGYSVKNSYSNSVRWVLP